MKKYKTTVNFWTSRVVELEALDESDFNDKVYKMTNRDIFGSDIVSVDDLEFDGYSNIEEEEEEEEVE